MDSLEEGEVVGDGNCGLFSVFTHALIDGGMHPASALKVLSMEGASPVARKAMDDLLMLCRKLVVDYARLSGTTFYPEEGPVRTKEELEELCHSGEIKSMIEWSVFMLLMNTYFDEFSVCFLGKLCGLPNTPVVKKSTVGIVDIFSAEPPSHMSNIVLHRNCHYSPLVSKVSIFGRCFVFANTQGFFVSGIDRNATNSQSRVIIIHHVTF